MNITVIGSGYVGLVSGACLADLGNNVICLDVDPKKIEMLQAGQVPIYEPCLLYTSPSPRDLSTSRMPSSA